MTTNQNYSFLAKVIVIGDSGVGKTNLLTKFCDGVFKDSYVATIGVDFKIKTVNVDDKKIKLQIWDTAGQQRFRNITQTYYKGASGIILAYSINSKSSFRNITSWIKQIETNASDSICIMMVGTKGDLESDREVQVEEAEQMAQKHNMSFMEVSAKSGKNVVQSFMQLTKEIKTRKAANGIEQDTSINLAGDRDGKNKCAC